ncbi:NAD(P)/FAD-dependent oxidoreductase [Spirillospora sp. NPDC029432]|uniref:flavin-containing monooxygenase n=1 Tax=Spirillospora sp. NPDC029432 TaxID=3154599 RepID=UPI00345337C1
MFDTHAPVPPAAGPDDPGFDPEALRAKYRAERDRRIRPDGAVQYQEATGDFAYYADDPYADPDFARDPLHDSVEVAVIGGGFGGLLAAARLRRHGVESIRVIEKGGDFGGTWYWNRYPGIHCDIESYVYMPLLEEVGSVPEWKYAPGEEIRRHAQAIGRTFDLYRDACFQTEVTELRWDEEAAEWLLGTDRADRIRARYVVVTNGTFLRPKLPGIPGIRTFKGHTFHTNRWDYDYTGGGDGGNLHGLAGKRVALVGTGATAVQVVPHLGRDAGHLYVFQRTPSSVDVRGNRRTDPEWAASLEPGWQRRRMDNFLSIVSGEPVEEDLVGDAWTSTARRLRAGVPGSGSPSSGDPDQDLRDELDDFRKMNELRARVDGIVRDPRTAELLKPWYRYECKRPTFSDEYLQTFNRPNVTLVDTADHGGVERVEEDAVVVGGARYEVDCIIFATGFDSPLPATVSGRLPAYGRGGVTMAECWKDGPRTFQAFCTRGFPNLFQLGSIQGAPAVNFVHVLDTGATHIAAVIAAARERGARYVEPTEEAEAGWIDLIDERAPDLYRFQMECTPGYKNREGMPPPRSQMFGDGPVAFQELLRRWREDDRFGEVLVPDTGGRK